MTALLVLVVALVVVEGLLVMLAQRNEDVADERAELATVRESLRVVTADLDTVTADRARLRTLHKLDPDANWDQQVADLTRQLADTGRLLQAETKARVAAQHQLAVAHGDLRVLSSYLDSEFRGVELARKVLAAADTEYVGPDPAGKIPRLFTVQNPEWKERHDLTVTATSPIEEP